MVLPEEVTLVVAVDSALPQHVCLDAGLLRQMLLNVLSNAIKYTRAGGKVEVKFTKVQNHTTIHPRSDSLGCVCLSPFPPSLVRLATSG